KIMNNNFIIILSLLLILFIIGIFLFAIFILPRFIKSNRMKRYAASINANFLKREKDGVLKMFNIITGEYNGKPIEIYHYKLSSFWWTSTPFYKTYLNGKSYDGLLSVQEISKILTVGDKTIIGRFSAVRRHWPY
ncbi:MAG: hypothetical protein Q8P97_02470, partial [bacterium]|nr:hypothetical protein [bacterium]